MGDEIGEGGGGGQALGVGDGGGYGIGEGDACSAGGEDGGPFGGGEGRGIGGTAGEFGGDGCEGEGCLGAGVVVFADTLPGFLVFDAVSVGALFAGRHARGSGRFCHAGWEESEKSVTFWICRIFATFYNQKRIYAGIYYLLRITSPK